MILFGHIGITLFLGNLLSLALLYVFMGAVLPDLIDKPLQILGVVTSGRFIGHTLFMGILISCIVYLITRRKLFSISLLFGYWIHLLEDALYFIPWFYPFIDYDFPAYAFGPRFTLFNIVCEFLGFAMLIYVIRTNSHLRNYFTKNFNNFKLRINRRKIPE